VLHDANHARNDVHLRLEDICLLHFMQRLLRLLGPKITCSFAVVSF
jgi:hypothetical protein